MYNRNQTREKWISLAPGLMKCAEDAYNSTKVEQVFPARELVFRAFDFFPPEDTRVVILGQDPYHTQGKASGLAFGYHVNYKGPVDSSLANILAEVDSDKPSDITLSSWAKQGVLLLNTRLTVLEGKPMSHANIGWELEIYELLKNVELLARRCVYLGWGAEARKVISDLDVENVIYTSHPCRYSHKATDKPFTGSNCFERANELLVKLGKGKITWK